MYLNVQSSILLFMYVSVTYLLHVKYEHLFESNKQIKLINNLRSSNWLALTWYTAL